MKVTIVGAGNVGASCAEYILLKEIVDEIILLDIKEGFAEGKALDLTQTTSTLGFKSKVTGVTNDYSKTSNSDVVVITSGIPRKPGMTREELIGINAGIVKSVSENLLKHSPNAIIIVVSNPMDTMTYLVNKSFDIPRNRIIGMGGILDSSRFKTYISKFTNHNQHDIHAMVIGGHGDTTMIPLTSLARCKNELLSDIVSKDELKNIASQTMVGGATLTKLLGTSAWYAPGASVSYLVKAIINDTKVVTTGGSTTGLIGDQLQSTWNTGTGTTESLISPAKLKASVLANETTPPSTFATIGTYSFMQYNSGTLASGDTVSGTLVRPASTNSGGFHTGSYQSGTWRCMAVCANNQGSLFLRLT